MRPDWCQPAEGPLPPPLADPYIPSPELRSAPLRPLHASTCRDAFRLQSDCPDPKASLPKGAQRARPTPAHPTWRCGFQPGPAQAPRGAPPVPTVPPKAAKPGRLPHSRGTTDLHPDGHPRDPAPWGDSPFRFCADVGQPWTWPGLRLQGAPGYLIIESILLKTVFCVILSHKEERAGREWYHLLKTHCKWEGVRGGGRDMAKAWGRPTPT